MVHRTFCFCTVPLTIQLNSNIVIVRSVWTVGDIHHFVVSPDIILPMHTRSPIQRGATSSNILVCQLPCHATFWKKTFFFFLFCLFVVVFFTLKSLAQVSVGILHILSLHECLSYGSLNFFPLHVFRHVSQQLLLFYIYCFTNISIIRLRFQLYLLSI